MPSSRRAFIRGQWNSEPRHVEIVSLIVSTWPQYLDAVSKAVLALGNTEIHGHDPIGKLIVVIEEVSQGDVGAKTNAICGLPHVLSAVMVFQASDDAEAVV
jgi:nitrate reductase NapAB chaperone NapD